MFTKVFHMKHINPTFVYNKFNLNAPPGGAADGPHSYPLAIHRTALRTRKQRFARVDQV